MKKVLRMSALALAILAVGMVCALFAIQQHINSFPSVAKTAVLPAAVLRQGSTGGEVKEVQRRLKEWGYYTGAVDGIYGSGTREAVRKFQQKNGLTADGNCTNPNIKYTVGEDWFSVTLVISAKL